MHIKMKIGIDAKRVFLNQTGLGSYGRNLIAGLNELESADEFVLYSTGKGKIFKTDQLGENFSAVFSGASVKAFWRSYSIINNLKKEKIDLYHGISSELPFSLKNHTEIVKIVDIHDLLFLRFPDFYSLTDRKMFELKTKFACEIADKIIATSEATKQDIINYYHTPAEKIEVVYQSCSDAFFTEATESTITKTRKKYKLPKDFLLCVGTIQERKNQKQILEALKISKYKLPLVLIGTATKYKDQLVAFAKEENLDLIIPDVFVKDEDLPAIYQMARIFVFPGLYEGFGIPVLEAMASKIPVITSLNTSMAEIVNNIDCLVNPLSAEDLAEKIDTFLENDNSDNVNQNYNRALEFTNKKFAEKMTKIYDQFRNN